MALSLTAATDYALRALIHIASMPEGAVVLRSEVAETQKMPASFMAKILRKLVQAGILESFRGVSGGFSLARPAPEITILDIVEAIEGPLSLMRCSTHADQCGWSSDCPASLVWPTIQQSLEGSLRGLSLEDLANTSRRNGRVAVVPGMPKMPKQQSSAGANLAFQHSRLRVGA